MLLFIKQLRQQLIIKGKFKNYLLYALGEIVLVVAGILIALAINNTQEDRVLRNKEQAYLIGLEKEFEISQRKLQELIRVNRSSYEKATSIITQISTPAPELTEREFSNLLHDAFSRDLSYNPNTSLIQEMISSGSLKDLSDKELRIQLTNWLATLEDISGQERNQELRRNEVMKIFETNEASVRTILDHAGVTETVLNLKPLKDHRSNLRLKDNMAFENNLLLFVVSAKATETNHYEPLIKDIEQILEAIRNNLVEYN